MCLHPDSFAPGNCVFCHRFSRLLLSLALRARLVTPKQRLDTLLIGLSQVRNPALAGTVSCIPPEPRAKIKSYEVGSSQFWARALRGAKRRSNAAQLEADQPEVVPAGSAGFLAAGVRAPCPGPARPVPPIAPRRAAGVNGLSRQAMCWYADPFRSVSVRPLPRRLAPGQRPSCPLDGKAVQVFRRKQPRYAPRRTIPKTPSRSNNAEDPMRCSLPLQSR